MNVPFLNLKALHDSIRPEIDEAIARVIDNNSFILGEEVEAFEEEFANYIGTKYCVGVSSGLDALRICINFIAQGKKLRIGIPENTFIATALAAEGHDIVFLRCSKVTMNITEIRNDLDLIIPVHFAGSIIKINEFDMQGMNYPIVLEDACQAHGSIDDCGNKAGNLQYSIAGCFSHYPGKNLGGLGDAGSITTNDEHLYDYVKQYQHYGQDGKYNHVVRGGNNRMDGIQAAVLRVKLKYLDGWNKRRNEIADAYKNGWTHGIVGTHQLVEDGFYSCYHLFVLHCGCNEIRDKLQDFLNDNGIQTGIHYPELVQHTKAYFEYRYKNGNCYQSFENPVISLPICPMMTDEQVEYVCKKMREFNTLYEEGKVI